MRSFLAKIQGDEHSEDCKKMSGGESRTRVHNHGSGGIGEGGRASVNLSGALLNNQNLYGLFLDLNTTTENSPAKKFHEMIDPI